MHELLKALRQKRLSIGFAESCTGGLLSALLTSLPGVSDVFLGAVITYGNEVKRDVLGVHEDILARHGAVSKATALQMARGICRVLKTSVAIAITGIAGPSGGSPEKPVGTVFIAIKGPGFEDVKRELLKGTRVEIQRQSALCAVTFLLESMEKGGGS